MQMIQTKMRMRGHWPRFAKQQKVQPAGQRQSPKKIKREGGEVGLSWLPYSIGNVITNIKRTQQGYLRGWTYPCLKSSKLANSAQNRIFSLFCLLFGHLAPNSFFCLTFTFSSTAKTLVRWWCCKAEPATPGQSGTKTGSALGLLLASLSPWLFSLGLIQNIYAFTVDGDLQVFECSPIASAPQ